MLLPSNTIWFSNLDYVGTWWRLPQKGVMCTTLDINVFSLNTNEHMVKRKFNTKFQRNRFFTPVGMWFMANIRTMNRSILLVNITYGNNKQIYVRWEFQWHEYIVKINFINYFSFHFVLGILLVISSQNEATLQTRHIHRIVKLHNMYRRMFANGAYNVFVADMKKLVIYKFKYKMVNGMVNLYGVFL